MAGDGVYSQTRRGDHLKRASDLCIQLGVEEVVMGVGEAEGSAQEGLSCGPIGGVAEMHGLASLFC